MVSDVIGPAGDAAARSAALLLEHDALDAPFSRGALAEHPARRRGVARPARRAGSARRRARVARDVHRPAGLRGRRRRDRRAENRPRPRGSRRSGGRPGPSRFPCTSPTSIFNVPENSLLDVEARARGTTTLVDRRRDMLPELLSADLASLVRETGSAGDVLRL